MPTVNDLLQSALLPTFEENFLTRGDLGASVSIFLYGEEILNLSQGYLTREKTEAWTADTVVPVWSATKGPAAVTCLLALENVDVSLDHHVCEIWPEFAQNGKERITFRQLLSHTAGLSALDESAPIQDFDAVIKAIEHQAPLFSPGTRQGYHARTFGFLLDQIVRLTVKAESLGAYFRKRLGDPMNLDFWIGLPAEMQPRVATLYPGKMRVGANQDPFMTAFMTKGSVTQRTFASPSGLHAAQDMNKPEVLAQGFASMGGVGSARALAAFYGMLANGGIWQGQTLVSKAILKELETTFSQQDDAVLCTPLAFSTGVMRDPVDENGQKNRSIYGRGLRAFGHPGAGGSLAFADPGRGLSFAYVMNQMEPGALPNEKALSLVRAMDDVL